jgi:hypothetical protein
MSVKYGLMLATVAANGILVGASLDQTIKQLPARRTIGSAAYASYARAADGGNDVAWYAVLGVGSALLTLGTAASVRSPALYVAALLTVAHSYTTTQAAPIMLGLRATPDDEVLLSQQLDRFEHWQKARAALQGLTFASLLWALATSR